MRVRCPHCHQPIELVNDDLAAEVICSSCGGSFSLISGESATQDYIHQRRMLGQFELLERVGMGKFGSVWKARDTQLDRIVAVKIPRKDQVSSAEAEMFFREARTAAQLKHPNIVSVHEVGREGESIYIVSDFVQGANLREWLSAQRLTPREAAELCAKIADAVAHAHAAGVVHRDLKPGNIMLDADGQPHITDFGLAKREAAEITMTLDGAIMGTPAYMSPEQARGEAHQADARSDVYSLGVILFELLTGELPFRGETRMLIVQILKEEPPSPRKLNARIPRDLETICLKCLEKDPKRRYATATELAAELRRFLDGKPILARPIGRAARVSRWCKRQPLVASLIAAVIVSLTAGTGVATYFAVAERNRATSEMLARKHETAVVRYMVNAFQSADSARDGRTVTVVEVFDRAAKKLDQDFSDDPLTKAELLHAIGVTYLDLGLANKAVGLLERARRVREDFGGENDPALLSWTPSLGLAYLHEGQIDKALALFDQALKRSRATLGDDHPDTLILIGNMAAAYERSGQLDKALTLWEEAVTTSRAKLGDDHPDTLTSIVGLAASLRESGHLSRALPLYEEALRRRRAKLGANHPDTLASMNGLAVALQDAGQLDKSIALYEEALLRMKAALGVDHSETLRTTTNLASAYRRSQQTDRALPLAEDAFKRLRATLGDDHPLTIMSMEALAGAHLDLRQWNQALPLYEEALKQSRSNLGDDHPNTLILMKDLAVAYELSGQSDKAKQLNETINRKRARPGFHLAIPSYGVNTEQSPAMGDADLWRRFGPIYANVERSPPRERAQGPLIIDILLPGARKITVGAKSEWSPGAASLLVTKPEIGSANDCGLIVIEIPEGAGHELVAIGKDPAWSPSANGPIAFVRGSVPAKEEIWLIEADGTKERKVGRGGYPHWSGDGNTLYFNDRDSTAIVAVSPSYEQAAPRLVLKPVPSRYPVVSPDGSYTAYVTEGKGLVVVKCPGGELVRNWPLEKNVDDGLVAWHPDGKKLAYSGFSRATGLWLADLDTGKSRMIVPGKAWRPAWSHDGKHFLFAIENDIYVIDTDKLPSL